MFHSVRLLTLPMVSYKEIQAWLKEDCKCTEPYEMSDCDNATKMIELAARRCYLSFEAKGQNPNVKQRRADIKAFIHNILKSGHGSVLEHVQVSFAFEGFSRVFTHELVRHRAGCAYSQESMRFVRMTDFDMWVPSCIKGNVDALKLFCRIKFELQDVQKQLAEIFDIDNPNMPFSEKKELTSAFRRLLPIGVATGIIGSFNFRALRHIIRMRTAIGAEEEIRIAFDKVATICVKQWPMIFQDFSCDADKVWTSEFAT